MKKYKFGVIITSNNERTEKACLEAFKNFNSENVHLVKNFYPAIEAFKEVCKISLKKKYDYIFNVDADVILLDRWFEIINHSIINDDNFFLKTFTINDKYFDNIDKGNKLYNCKYFNELLNKIDLNYKLILKNPKPMGFTNRYIDAKHEYIELEKPIGIHGYEQYYIDIYYRFYLLKIRYKNFNHKKMNFKSIDDLKEKIIIKKALKNSNRDRLTNLFKSIFFKDFSYSNGANKFTFLNKLELIEKEPLSISRNDILKNNGFK